jgi:hypothetical protein
MKNDEHWVENQHVKSFCGGYIHGYFWGIEVAFCFSGSKVAIILG